MKRTEEEIREYCEVNIYNLRKTFSDALSKIGTDDEYHEDFVKIVIGQKDAFLNLKDFLDGKEDIPDKIKKL